MKKELPKWPPDSTAGTYLGLPKGGGAEVCGGTGVTPSKIKKSSDLGNYFLGWSHFANEKKIENIGKKFDLWPHPDSYLFGTTRTYFFTR